SFRTPTGEGVIPEAVAPLAVSGFGEADHAVEGRQVGLELEPRFPTAAGGIRGVRILQDQPFVSAVARGAEGVLNFLRRRNRYALRNQQSLSGGPEPSGSAAGTIDTPRPSRWALARPHQFFQGGASLA